MWNLGVSSFYVLITPAFSGMIDMQILYENAVSNATGGFGPGPGPMGPGAMNIAQCEKNGKNLDHIK